VIRRNINKRNGKIKKGRREEILGMWWVPRKFTKNPNS
jgi:hypothetical protein